MRYSPSMNGFYPENIAYPTLPGDLVTITDEEYLALLAAQAEGKEIVAVNGLPAAQTPAGPTIEQRRVGWTVSAFQAQAALFQVGKLDEAQAAVEAAGGVVLLAWNKATEFQRLSPSMLALAPLLGLTDEDLDTLFTIAEGIVA